MLETWAKGSFSHSLGVHKMYLSPSLSFVLLSSEAVLCACSFMIVQRQLRFHLHFQPGFTSADKINPPCLILPVCMCQLHTPIRWVYSTYTHQEHMMRVNDDVISLWKMMSCSYKCELTTLHDYQPCAKELGNKVGFINTIIAPRTQPQIMIISIYRTHTNILHWDQRMRCWQ